VTTRTAWGSGQRLLTAGLVFLVTATAFEGLAIPTVLPDTLEQLGGLDLYGWAFSGYWLANLVGITLAGIEADRRGPLRPFVAGGLLAGAGLAVAALGDAMAWVVLGRVVQGFGAGAIGAIVYVAIARGYDASAQPRMIAVISSAWVIPGLVGPAVAGIVAEQFGWRWVFGGLAPLLPLAAIVVARPLGQLRTTPVEAGTPAPPRALDAILLALGSALVLGAVSVRPVVAGAALAAVGVLLARRALVRLLPPGTLRARPGRGAGIAALALVSIAFFGAEAFVPLAVSSVRNAGTVAGGLALTTAAVTWAAGSWIEARLAARGLRRTLVGAGFMLVLLGIGLETAVPLTALAPVWIAPLAWAIAGLGMGLTYSTVTLVALETAPPGAEGATSAAVQLANTLGIAVGTGLAGAIVAYTAASGPGLAPGIALANLLMLLVGALGLLVARRLPEPSARAVASPGAVPAEHGPSL